MQLLGIRLARAQAANSARWEAMGDFYARLDSAGAKSTVNADVARWIGLGEYYEELRQVTDGE